MTARTHDLAAITALGLVYFSGPNRTMSLATALVAILANQLGGIAPDIDQPTAPFWRQLPIGGVIGKIIGKSLGGHRFITHSILGLGIFGVLVYLLLAFIHPIIPTINIDYVWWAFMIGMLSHLIMDTFTKEGVPWLLPIPIKFGFPPIKSLRITTGGNIEKFVVFPGLLIFDIAFCAAHYHQLLTMIHYNFI